jgi:DNA polymerase-3 subunit epsilon
MAAVHDAVPLRQCSPRLSIRRTTPACALAELGRCPAPCEHRISVADYGWHATAFRDAVAGDPGPVLDRLLERIGKLAAAQRFEDAAAVRLRLVAFLRTAVRMQRLVSLTSIGEFVAARPQNGGWELTVVRHGRLVAAGTSPPGAHPRPTVEALLATAETVSRGPGPTPCASAGETERIIAWLERPETRLVRTNRGWACLVAGAERWRGLLRRAEAASAAADPFSERRLRA